MRPAPRAPAERPDGGAWGRVSAPFERGSVLLVSAHGENAYRLVFDDGGSFWVPAGQWRVANYRIQIDDWQLSASGPNGRTIRVRDGAELALPIETALGINVSASRQHGQIAGCIGWRGDNDMGATITRAGVRSTARAEFLDAGGDVVAEADLAYG